MKKISALIMCLILAFSFAACSQNEEPQGSDSTESTNKLDYRDFTEVPGESESGDTSVSIFPCVTDSAEAELYHSVFFDGNGASHENEEVKKTGTFAILQDAFNGVTRYYVWGYGDGKKGNDWQWELKVENPSSVPAVGSLIDVTGIFEKSGDALDGYWISQPSITVRTAFKGEKCDIDMSVMSATLERVQMTNILNYKDDFSGKKIAAYGRVISGNLIAHPYDDDSWQLHYKAEGEIPGENTMVRSVGVFRDGILDEAVLTEVLYY